MNWRKSACGKNAAEFEAQALNKTVRFEFADAFDKRWPHASRCAVRNSITCC